MERDLFTGCIDGRNYYVGIYFFIELGKKSHHTISNRLSHWSTVYRTCDIKVCTVIFMFGQTFLSNCNVQTKVYTYIQ